ERDKLLEIRSSTLRMSYIITDKGYMPDSSFLARCEAELKPFAAGNNFDFAVILKKYCGPLNYRNEENLKLIEKSAEVFDRICSSDKALSEITPQESESAEPIKITQKNSVILTYPVAVDCEGGTRGLGMMVVAGWEAKRKVV
ncbi:MAG: hypothetical protein ABH863_06165, partial [Candidatus Micrarchaeota archaeon]